MHRVATTITKPYIIFPKPAHSPENTQQTHFYTNRNPVNNKISKIKPSENIVLKHRLFMLRQQGVLNYERPAAIVIIIKTINFIQRKDF